MRYTLGSGIHAPAPRTLAAAAALGFVALLAACGGGYGGGGGSGSMLCGGVYAACPPPTVSVTAPATGTTVTGTAVALTATATASSAHSLTISRVDFMIDGAVVGTVSSAPYTVNWDSTSVANGDHMLTAKATDSMSDTATSTAVTLKVQNMAALGAAMTPAQVFPTPRSSATGVARVTVRLTSGAASGKVTVSGFSARAVTLNEGFAGSNGDTLLALTPTAAAGEWEVPAGALLTAEQVRALMQGKLYVLASSAANPRGELRGQLLPDNVKVSFSALAPAPQALALGISAAAVAATTVDSNAQTLTLHVNSTGVDDAMAAQVITGTAATALTKDSVDMGHWSIELAPITAAELGRFRSGAWAVRVATPTAPAGALGGAINAPATH